MNDLQQIKAMMEEQARNGVVECWDSNRFVRSVFTKTLPNGKYMYWDAKGDMPSVLTAAARLAVGTESV